MRVLGLDFGERRIGVALSDPLGLTAQGLTVLTRTTTARDLEAIGTLIDERKVDAVVVGWPLAMSGRPGPQAARVEAFVQALRRRVQVPVTLLDERFTTAQGERVLLEADVSRRRRKQVIDQVAAQLILQHYLERERLSKNA